MPLREDIRPDRLVAIEEEVLRLWESEQTFARCLEARRGAKPFSFYDGPPTANGKPGIHHLISRSIKDFACRLKTMQGFLVERKAGWDTHGLPVEIETEKKLGLEGKDAIERLGIAAFNKACRESVFTYLDQWVEFTRRTGYWVDLKSAYITCSNEYIESLWHLLADFHKKGLLVKGHKVLPYCPRCGTPLSSHEVGLGFRDVQDPSVFVRFRALDAAGNELPESYLVWTTTPWTLPSNVALAVHPDVEYVRVRLRTGPESESLWLAKERLGPLLQALKIVPSNAEIVETVRGSDLVGRRYQRLLDFYDVPSSQNGFTIRPAAFVTTTDGTGIVHMAPAYGEDDAAVGRRDELPVLHPVDAKGQFVSGPRAGLVAGKPVKQADKDILRLLKEKGLLVLQETLVHSYPHCWRCETPLLYYARDSWYLATTRYRERMIALNAEVAWYPDATGRGRFGQWLENNVDWAISRDRYWGTPLPVWVCDRCKRQEAVGSIEELRRKAGRLPEALDLHRPYVDEPTWACATAGCAGAMRRTPEVVDCWFDSGSMPFAQWHYPFAPGSVEKVREAHPADFIAEGIDQTRGWFYSLLAVSTMHADKGAYRACVSNDMVLDSKGKKMSKSRGNVVDPLALVAKFGADASRWYLLASRPVWLPMRFDEQELVELRNRLFGTLANTYQFFAMYANPDGFDAGAAQRAIKPSSVFDRWLLSRVHRLVRDVSSDVAAYETSRAGKRIVDFVVEDLSNWYVRRNRRRFWKGALTPDKREGYETLRATLLTVCRLMAPFAPFLTDAMHRALLGGSGGAEQSVHLASWPVVDSAAVDDALEANMEALRQVVTAGHSARQEACVKVRQPLPKAYAAHSSSEVQAFLEAHRSIIEDELNLKDVQIEAPWSIPDVRFVVEVDKKAAAPRLARQTGPVLAAVSSWSKDEHASAAVAKTLGKPVRVRVADGTDVDLLPEETTIRVVELEAGSGVGKAVGSVVVRLVTAVTPALAAECLAREFVHGLQALRKTKGLKVTDRVKLAWKAEGTLADAIRTHRAYIDEEILAVSSEPATGLASPDADEVEVDGVKALVRLDVVPR